MGGSPFEPEAKTASWKEDAPTGAYYFHLLADRDSDLIWTGSLREDEDLTKHRGASESSGGR